jgi:hypothetical protein
MPTATPLSFGYVIADGEACDGRRSGAFVDLVHPHSPHEGELDFPVNAILDACEPQLSNIVNGVNLKIPLNSSNVSSMIGAGNLNSQA